MTAAERAEHLKDLRELESADEMQRVLAAYFLWFSSKEKKENGYKRDPGGRKETEYQAG
jgi:hypothetical protein